MIIFEGEREREETVTLFLFTYFVIHQDTLACIILYFPYFVFSIKCVMKLLKAIMVLWKVL